MSLPDLGALVCLDGRLREVAVDPLAVESALGEAMRALEAAEDPAERLSLLIYAGNAARVLGRADESIALARLALESAWGDRAIAARIRLGEAYRCADRPAEAIAELERALDDARGVGTHVDFALQHLGKALLDAGERARAAALLEKALELRRRGGEAALIESTERALAKARS